MCLYRKDVLNVQRIPDMLNAWTEPPHDWGGPTAYRLFNAATFALTGKVAENPNLTRTVHQVIDGICERVN